MRGFIDILNESRLDELVYPKNDIKQLTSEDKLQKYMESFGFNNIGESSVYGLVFEHPKLNYIVKVFQKRDRCYRGFVNLAMRHQDNPHFPKFRGKLIDLTEAYVGIRMERLNPMTTAKQGKIQEDARKFLEGSHIADRELSQHYPILEMALELLMMTKDKINCQVDLHSGNMMVRGDTLVIIDPWKI